MVCLSATLRQAVACSRERILRLLFALAGRSLRKFDRSISEDFAKWKTFKEFPATLPEEEIQKLMTIGGKCKSDNWLGQILQSTDMGIEGKRQAHFRYLATLEMFATKPKAEPAPPPPTYRFQEDGSFAVKFPIQRLLPQKGRAP